MLIKINSLNIRSMKLLTIYFMAFLFILPNCVSVTGQSDKKSRQKIIQKKNKPKITVKKPTTNTQIKKTINRQTKKMKSISKKRLLAKEDILPKDYYKPEKSKKELQTEFEKHLENLNQTCETKSDREEFLQKQLNSFEDFLKTSLKDPNMDYTLRLLFSDINSVLEEMNYNNSINLNTFIRLYRMLYKLPEDIEIKDYPDNWAKTIAQSIECRQQAEKKIKTHIKMKKIMYDSKTYQVSLSGLNFFWRFPFARKFRPPGED